MISDFIDKFKAKTFGGGIHPPDCKKLTNLGSIEVVPAPETAVIPLSQHIGAPANPVVAKGDTVRVGQVLGEPSGFISAYIHSSVSGTVKALEDRPSVLGFPVLSVVIENNKKDEKAYSPETEGIASLSPEQVVERIRKAGIVGMGGATFPSDVKLSPPGDKHIDTFILNAAECEPYLTADHRVMIEKTNEVIGGMRFVMRILGVKHAYIGIELNKPDVIKAFKHITEREKNISVIPLKMKYPQGGEKQLIKAVTGREVPSGGLPMDVGCVVHNVGTVAAIFEALTKNKPLIDRVVTVTGSIVNEPKNVLARIGTPVSDLIKFCGGVTEPAAKMICGGPMMGIAQNSTDIHVVKGMSGLILQSEQEVRNYSTQTCISCGSCVDVCPMGLVPTMLMKMIRNSEFIEARNGGLLDCMECGSCAYDCPSRINLVHFFKWGKSEVAELRKKGKI